MVGIGSSARQRVPESSLAGRLSIAVVATAMAVACSGPTAGPGGEAAAATWQAATSFVEVTREAGIAHRHQKPSLDPRVENIMPWLASVGAAASAGDYDNDGWVDLYVTNSRKGTPNFLYRNNGDGTFEDVGAAAGVAAVNDDGGVSTDCIWADLDNDGWLDLYVVRWGEDVLFRNDGDGTFTDVTRERFSRPDGSPGTPWANGNAVIALDYDRDSRLDLYVGNYFAEVDLWHLESTRIMHDSFEIARNAGRNYLYHQEPDGRFVDVAADLGLDDPGWTLAVGSADVDNDTWPDIYIANDFGPDQLFVSDRRGGLVNVSETAIGVDTRKGMNVDFGDFNNDGWLDIYVTNITTVEYLREGNMLWRNNGPDLRGGIRFMDISAESSTFDGGWGWGAKFLDHDNDGDLDLFTVNGFISGGEGNYWYDLASWSVLDKDPTDALNWPTIGDRSFSGYETYRFFDNEGFETFSERSSEVGLDRDSDGRGIVCFDYDNDGDIDIFVANQGQAPFLFRNDPTRQQHSISFRLEGDPAAGSNADAIGARVTVVAGGELQVRERDGGNGYSGQSDPRPHFGLGERDRVELVEVRWSDGGIQYLEDVAADQIVTVRQDPGRYAATGIAVDAPTPRAGGEEAGEPELPPIDREVLEQLLAGLEEQLIAHRDDHVLAHVYRRRCAEYGQQDRAIEFFHGLSQRDPEDRWARLELAVAHIDKIPTCGGIAAIVCKGTLARRSLDELNVLIEQDPRPWIYYYARGMNHLHWPRALRHSGAAAEDFAQCLRIQRSRGDEQAYYERTYILLGDAHTKNGTHAEAREAWSEGLRVFPDSAELRERLAVQGDSAQLEWVESRRTLDQPIDTDLSFAPSR